jgi:hypothetical protein
MGLLQVSSLITGLANETASYGSDRIGLALGRAVACEGGSEAALHGRPLCTVQNEFYLPCSLHDSKTFLDQNVN